MKIYQILTTMSFGDAVSNDCLAIDKLLRKEGYSTAIFAENLSDKAESLGVRNYRTLPKFKKDDVILYHLSTGTELNRKVAEYDCRKYIIYHNTTPPDFFVPYSGKLARLCNNGLEETKALNNTFDGGFCDSDYNRQQLVNFGYKCPLKVRPILIPFEDYKKEPNQEILEKMGGDPNVTPHEVKNILFVGRIAPNKCQEDLISLIYAYRNLYSTPVRLILVGNPGGMEKFMAKLKAYASTLGLDDIVFTGQISFPAILAYYRSADCFVSMSEHEGFCMPLIEAMNYEIPVVAYKATAIPDTMGDAGVLLESKDPKYVCEKIDKIFEDESYRKQLIEGQNRHIDSYIRDDYEKKLFDIIEEVKSITSYSYDNSSLEFYKILLEEIEKLLKIKRADF